MGNTGRRMQQRCPHGGQHVENAVIKGTRKPNFMFRPPIVQVDHESSREGIMKLGWAKRPRLEVDSSRDTANPVDSASAKLSEPVRSTSVQSLRHMPFFEDNSLTKVVESVLQKQNAVLSPRAAGGDVPADFVDDETRCVETVVRDAKSGTRSVKGKLKRTVSECLVDRVAETMADRRMGSYIVCH